MSAATTAAGYLYASGRLRSRTDVEEEQQARQGPRVPGKAPPRVRVAVYPKREEPRRTPKIEYRIRRRWSLE